jgi:hypothetical protein
LYCGVLAIKVVEDYLVEKKTRIKGEAGETGRGALLRQPQLGREARPQTGPPAFKERPVPPPRLRMSKKQSVRGLLMACLALCCGAGYNILIFGSLFSKSAMEYSKFHIGFLPIAQYSLFWPLLLAVLLSIGFFSLVKKCNYHLLLLYGFLIVQSLYFLGRSHDNNLLNLSGIFLTVVFIALSALYEGGYRRTVRVAVILIIFLGSLSGGGHLRVKAGNFRNHCTAGTLLSPSPMDTLVSMLRPHVVDPKKTVIVNSEDVYCNYRLGLPQTGPMVPFYSYIFLDDAARHLEGLLASGFTVLIAPSEEKLELQKLNQSPWLRQTQRKFLFEKQGKDEVWKLNSGPN